MRNSLVILVLCLCSLTNAVPLGLKKNMAIVQEQEDPMLMMAAEEETRPEMMISRLNLPSNATSIRADITDGFSCDNKTYGYYADVENECQIFHVCLPVTYADGKENTFRWSFICPEETVFSQEYFTCMRSEDMSIDCEESFKYYELNRNFGMIEPEEMPADEADEDMNMEDMPKQPSMSGEQDDNNKQSVEAAPVKKQTVKVQNSNRRKTQANRITIDGQRKKAQPVRRLPKPVIVATTAKPVVEESPIAAEPEVERTTLKYQRLTKRPIAVVPAVEQPKPEEPKPEKEVIRQDLYASKRKRPSYFPSRYDSVSQKESEAMPLPFLKTDIVMPKQPEPVALVPAESQAQASEIKEVSVKPQEEAKPEKIETSPIQKKEPAVVFIPIKEEEEKLESELKSETAPMPANTPSRVEVVEIPIQKVDEPLRAEGLAVVAQVPEVAAPEEAKPTADEVEPIKADEDEVLTEDAILKKIVAQIEKIAPPMRPAGEEGKTSQDPVQEPELVSLEEAEQTLQSLKSPELPKPIEPMKFPEMTMETNNQEKASLAEDIPKDKLEGPLADARPEIAAKVDLPVIEQKPEEPLANSELKSESPIKETMKIEIPAPEKVQETEIAAVAPEIPEVEKPKNQSNDSQNVEAPVPEPEAVLKSEIPEFQPLKPLEEMPLKEETPVPEPMTAETKLTPASEEMPNQEKQAEFETPSTSEEIIKSVEESPEIPSEPISKPMESLIEPEKAAPLEVQPANEKIPAAQESAQPANDNEEAQSLILDFISSLVNSENSNFQEQSNIPNELTSDSQPEVSIADQVVAEAKPKLQDETLSLPNNDKMYQIPVQVIESPNPESAAPFPVVPEPKLPLTVDDVVELVKESLDTPVEKDNIVQDQPSSKDEASSEEVKPIYQRYVELGSNLLKSEALTASDSDPVITATEIENENAASKVIESAQLALKTPEDSAVKTDDQPMVEDKPESQSSLSENSAKEGRSLNRFKMDPRKRRFLFRSDAR